METQIERVVGKEDIQKVLCKIGTFDKEGEFAIGQIFKYSHNGESLQNPKNEISFKKETHYFTAPTSLERVSQNDINFAAYNKMQQIVQFLTSPDLPSEDSIIESKVTLSVKENGKEVQQGILDECSLNAFWALMRVVHFQSYFAENKRFVNYFTKEGFKVELSHTNNDANILLTIYKNFTNNEKKAKESILEWLKSVNL